MTGIRNTWEKVLEIIQDRSYLDEETGCYVWIGSTNDKWYGYITCEGKRWLIHRLIHHKLICEVTEEEKVRHSCDNPSCWNPEHLLSGTVQDNADDMVKRNRQNKGSNQHRAVLTEDKVREIKAIEEMRYEHIARLYNVDASSIRKIKLGLLWKHVK